ncbi:hypothetical protein [Natrialba swarupiae]|uniref:Uncharacterized protein n=1 Tax=Natrialba swarupiae TaxID=2448032 RepID=A0A5D5AJS2_9EURY|nr:hypothetical protein [Natrialba swarupiae]TYT61999.1 hypothetical protein FYC77_11040 [Natrialba swarupiae]
MAFTTDEEPADLGVFALQMATLLLVPPLVVGLGLAAVSGAEHFLPGMAIGLVVGVSAAALRQEVRGARTGS